jgi:hypothetical protein
MKANKIGTHCFLTIIHNTGVLYFKNVGIDNNAVQ